MQIPASYSYSTDPAIIGDNRVLVATFGDETDLGDPYSATESITVLRGKTFKTISEIETLANELGLENSNVFLEDDGLNVRYAIVYLLSAYLCWQHFLPDTILLQWNHHQGFGAVGLQYTCND